MNLDTNARLDLIEWAMLNSDLPLANCPLKHYFMGGMYMRIIFMPAGTKCTSLIHKTNHPYFIMRGKVKVFSDNFGVQELEAPYIGETIPNTRRYLEVEKDTVWATVHRTDIIPESDSEDDILKAVNKIGLEIIEWRENEFLGGVVKNNKIINPKELQHAD